MELAATQSPLKSSLPDCVEDEHQERVISSQLPATWANRSQSTSSSSLSSNPGYSQTSPFLATRIPLSGSRDYSRDQKRIANSAKSWLPNIITSLFLAPVNVPNDFTIKVDSKRTRRRHHRHRRHSSSGHSDDRPHGWAKSQRCYLTTAIIVGLCLGVLCIFSLSKANVLALQLKKHEELMDIKLSSITSEFRQRLKVLEKELADLHNSANVANNQVADSRPQLKSPSSTVLNLKTPLNTDPSSDSKPKVRLHRDRRMFDASSQVR